MGWFHRSPESEPDDDPADFPVREKGRILAFGQSAFIEYLPGREQQYEVQKYDSDWGYFLDREEDARELLHRLDERDEAAMNARARDASAKL